MSKSEVMIIGGAIVLAFGIIPFCINNHIVEKYGKTACSFLLMLLQVVGTVASVYFYGDTGAFVASVIITVIVYIIAFVSSFCKAAMLGADDGDCILAGITQVLMPIGIAIIILEVLSSGKKKRK